MGSPACTISPDVRFRFGRVDPTERHKLSSRLPKIHLNYLRELAFLDIRDALWPLNVVMVLEAPNVELLQLGLAECNVGDAKFAKYLVEGGNKSAPRTVFPSLICLKVLLNSGDRSASLKLESLLRAYPQITHLEIPYFPLDALLVKPWLVPNLQHLRVADRRGSEIKRVVAARARGKIPLKVVEADWFSEELIKPVERKYLAGKVDLKFFNPHEHGGVVMVYDNSQDEGDDF